MKAITKTKNMAIDITRLIKKSETSVDNNSIGITAIGVGGAGCNTIEYLHKHKIQHCRLIACNTDQQSLYDNPAKEKIQLGTGLGAGTNIEAGRKAAIEAREKIDKLLSEQETKMLFITAGMGGGTGTGAAPVIAEIANRKEILTVSVVTLPFEHESDDTFAKAQTGLENLARFSDAIIIIQNSKIREVYPELDHEEAIAKVNTILATAIDAITNIIMYKGHINVDFQDISNMLQDSGVCVMSIGRSNGKDSLKEAIFNAFNNPLLKDCDFKSSENVLLNLRIKQNRNNPVKMEELGKLNDIIQEKTGKSNLFKTGISYTDQIEDTLEATIIVTGLGSDLTNISKHSTSISETIHFDFQYSAELARLPFPKNNNYNLGIKRKIYFDKDNIPVLCEESPKYKRNELENIPAIIRQENK